MSDSATAWTVVHQALCPWGFSRPEYWSGLPRSPPGDLPNPGIKLRSPVLQADSLLSQPPGKPSKDYRTTTKCIMYMYEKTRRKKGTEKNI